MEATKVRASHEAPVYADLEAGLWTLSVKTTSDVVALLDTTTSAHAAVEEEDIRKNVMDGGTVATQTIGPLPIVGTSGTFVMLTASCAKHFKKIAFEVDIEDCERIAASYAEAPASNGIRTLSSYFDNSWVIVVICGLERDVVTTEGLRKTLAPRVLARVPRFGEAYILSPL